jgi:hypothetical protein
MAAAVWRVEFDRAATRDLRNLGLEAERRVLRYLRERIAGAEGPAPTGSRADRRPQRTVAVSRRRLPDRGGDRG